MKSKQNRVVNWITRLRDGCRSEIDVTRHAIASFAGRHRHRVDKSLPGRHSRPADAARDCRHLPTRPASRHFRRQGRVRKCRACARSRVIGPGNGKGRRTLRHPHFSTLPNLLQNASRVKQKMLFQGKSVHKSRSPKGFFSLPIPPRNRLPDPQRRSVRPPPSWSAQADHPRFVFVSSAAKTRGWSACADHDGRGTVPVEPDTPRRFPERLSTSPSSYLYKPRRIPARSIGNGIFMRL